MPLDSISFFAGAAAVGAVAGSIFELARLLLRGRKESRELDVTAVSTALLSQELKHALEHLERSHVLQPSTETRDVEQLRLALAHAQRALNDLETLRQLNELRAQKNADRGTPSPSREGQLGG